MKKPRILMLITEYLPIFSGHAIYLQALMPRFKKNGYSVEILTCDFQRFPSHEIIDGFSVYRLPFDPQSQRWEISLTLRIIRFLFQHRKEYDIIHINGHMDYFGALTLFSKCFRKKIIMQMVLFGADDPESLKSQYKFMSVRLRILSFIDRFIHISRPLGVSCINAGLPESKLCYIPQGVDTERFAPISEEERNIMRHNLGFAPKGHIVCFVGAVIERKGVDLLIQAWSFVQKEIPNATLVLVGPYDFGKDDANEQILCNYVEDIQRQISEQNLNVLMIGRSSRVNNYLQVSDLFVLPSRKEGFGNVILEAMACGVPPIVSFMDGVALESVIPNQTGKIIYLVDDLASAIIDLLKDDVLRKSMGVRARKDVLNRFALNLIAEKYMAIYDELLSN